jgi:hypothetical protein
LQLIICFGSGAVGSVYKLLTVCHQGLLLFVTFLKTPNSFWWQHYFTVFKPVLSAVSIFVFVSGLSLLPLCGLRFYF